MLYRCGYASNLFGIIPWQLNQENRPIYQAVALSVLLSCPGALVGAVFKFVSEMSFLDLFCGVSLKKEVSARENLSVVEVWLLESCLSHA